MAKNFFTSLNSKVASPACTELEVVMMDWLGKLIGLPPVFLAGSGGKGGGVIQVDTNFFAFKNSLKSSLYCLYIGHSKGNG
jgi:hypothetical protein